jgi:uncharacterized protein (DUF1330 family)
MKLFLFAIFLGALSMDAQTPAPSPSLVKDERVYELRTYYAADGKMEALHSRFRDHTMKIFAKHKMKVVGFWGPVDKEKGSENTLIYILEFPSRDAMKAAWDSFRKDPEWQAVAKASEVNGKLTSKVDSIVMKATDYEKMK